MYYKRTVNVNKSVFTCYDLTLDCDWILNTLIFNNLNTKLSTITNY